MSFRGNARGQRYQVAVNNPQTHEILDILPNRNGMEMIHYFSRFPRKERKKVKFVVMDLSSLFRRVVQTMFPCATIIGDRFHIQRLVIWALGTSSEKGSEPFFVRSGRFTSNETSISWIKEKTDVGRIWQTSWDSETIPGTTTCLCSKRRFFQCIFYERTSRCDTFLAQWLTLVEESGVDEFRSVLKTFKDWRQAILNGLTQVYSNGFTEGMNNKIKVLKRVAFGFRNFRRCRARILWASLKE